MHKRWQVNHCAASNEYIWQKDNLILLFFIFRPFGGLKNYHKVKQKSRQKAFFHMFKKLDFLKKLIWGRFLCAFSNNHLKSIWSRAKFEGFASLKFKTWWFLNKISYFIQRFLCARSSWAQIERSKVGSHLFVF